MRRLSRRGLVLAGPLLAVACKQPKRVRANAAGGDDGLRSMVFVADPKAAPQLVRGFHALEGNAWRWTMGRFTVTLRPPAYGDRDGGYLVVKLAVPDSVIDRRKSVRLSANVNGFPIDGETYTKSGDYIFRRDVPAAALKGEEVTVEFGLDQYLKAGEVEGRELGIIVSMVGFEAK